MMILLPFSLLFRIAPLIQITSSASTNQFMDRLERQSIEHTGEDAPSRRWNERHLNDSNQNRMMGVKRLLAVRVSNRAEAPRETLDEIEAAVFGTGRTRTNPHSNPSHTQKRPAASDASLVAQMRAVSHGALLYEPADFFAVLPLTMTICDDEVPSLNASSFNNHSDTGVWIHSGVLEMEIDVPTMMDTSGIYTHFNAVVKPAMVARMELLLQRPWDTVADHVLFCLPTGSLRTEAAAMGDVGGPFTYYHYESCTKLQVLMHEMGHNLNFLHGDVNGKEYADYSGYMGGNQAAPTWREQLFQSKSTSHGYPKKAFNGFNHWQSGWFQDQAVEVDPDLMGGSALHRIVSFVDYGNAAAIQMLRHSAVLIKVGSLYIQYNRAKGYNHDTPIPDTVTVTQAWTTTANSNRVAALREGATYTVYNVSTQTVPLVVQVCTMVREPVGVLDYADVSFHLDDGIQKSSCPPFTGKVSTGTGESVALASIVIGALQISDGVRTTVSVVFLLCCLVLAIVCLDACCVGAVYVLCCRSRLGVERDGGGPNESALSHCQGTSDDGTVIDEDTDESFA